MKSTGSLAGEVVQSDRPTWDLLTSPLGESIAEWFMWMYEVRLDDGSRLHAYKHVMTRRYLHLGPEGGAFAYDREGRYQPIPFASAVRLVFSGCERTLPDSHLLELWSAVESARTSETSAT